MKEHGPEYSPETTVFNLTSPQATEPKGFILRKGRKIPDNWRDPGDSPPAPPRFLLIDDPPAMDAAEIDLRSFWTSKGISEERQDEMIAEIERKAAPGAKIGPWTL